MGLLDALGSSMDDPKTAGILALAGGMINGGMGSGLLGFNDAYQKAMTAQLQRQDLAQQIELRKQQAAQLQRRNDMINNWLGQLDSSVPQANSAVAAQTGNLSPTIANASLQSQQLQRLNASNPVAGIPRQAIQADLAFNDGKGIGEWMFKRGVPDMQVSNGYAYDKNNLPQGFMPQLNISQNGQASLVTVGPDGMPVVSLPKGAAQTQAQNVIATKLPEAVINSAGTMNLRSGSDGKQYPVNSLQENPVLSQMMQSVFGGNMGGPATPAQTPPQLSPQSAPATIAPRGIRNTGLPLTPELQAAILADAKKNGITNPVVNLSTAESGMPSAAGFANPQIGLASQSPNPSAGYGKTTEQQSQEAARAEYLKKGAGTMVDYENSLNGRAEQSAALNMRLQEQLAALDKFRAGGGAETRAQLAQAAQAIPGMPQRVVNGIAGGNLASMQEFNKLAAQTAMESLKQSMGGSGRVSQMEFQVFLHNNPNLSTDPEAIRKIFAFQNRLYQKDLAEQDALQGFKQSGQDITTFPSYWQQQQIKLGYTDPKASTAAGANAKNLVDSLPKTAAPGTRARDTQTGQIMRFNGMQWVPEK